jgi:hypothetical protein
MQARAVGGTLLAFAVAGVVVIAVWVLRNDGSDSSRPAPEAATPAPKGPDAPLPSPAETGSAARVVDPIAAPPVEEAPEPVGVDLTVVDAATKLPYSDAEVWSIDAGEEDAVEREALANDLDRLVDRFGTKIEVDRSACAHLPAQPAVEIIARAPDRLARKVVQVADGPRQVVLLLPDQPLRVRVVDARGGRRADLPLVLESVDADEARFDAERAAAERADDEDRDPFRKRSPGRRDMVRGNPAKLWEGRIPQTGEDAEVPHGALLLMLSTEPDRIARARVLRFRLDVPLDVPITALVDPQLDVHATIELVAPDLAKLRVRLVESGGGPFRGAFRLTTRGAADGKGPESAPSQPPTQSGESEDGSPVELLVPVGARIEITALPADACFQSVTKMEATPERMNESRDVVLTVAPSKRRTPGTVTGRAIDPDGRVLANTALRWGGLHLSFGILDVSPLQVVHTDGGGVFTISRPYYGEVVSDRIDLSAPWSRFGSGLDPTMVATIETRRHAVDEVVEVGDVHFEAVPRLVAGHVVDPQGRGVAHASVTAWRPEDSRSFPMSRTLVSSRSGAFVMHCKWNDATLGVEAKLQDWFIPGTTVDEHRRLVVPRQNVAVGASDMKIELHRCGTVRGELLLDPGLEPSDVVLEIAPPCAARVVRGPENAFRIVGIPGEWSLGVRSRSGSLLSSVDGLRFEEDTVRTDRRLDPLDLSAVIRMPVQVSDEAGVPVAGADLAVLPPVGRPLAQQHATTDPFGREVIVAARGDGPLWVGADGLHWQRVTLEPVAKTLRLAPGIRVVGTIDVPPDLPETILARVTASPIQNRSTPSDELLGDLSPVSTWHPLRDGAFEVVVSGAFEYLVQFWLRDARRPESRSECLSAQRLAVGESSEPQRFRIDVRAEDLTAAIARLRR